MFAYFTAIGRDAFVPSLPRIFDLARFTTISEDMSAFLNGGEMNPGAIITPSPRDGSIPGNSFSDFSRSVVRILIQTTFLLVLICGPTMNCHTPESETVSDSERQVLGYTITCDEEDHDTCRLLDPEGTEIGRGSLDELQRQLGEVLKDRYGDGHPNLPFWTLGGKQFWADRYVLAGWRIQENVFTGHHRLLDPDDVRRAWGAYPECRAVFESIRARRSIASRRSHLVMLIHGILRSGSSMEPVRGELENAGYGVVSVNYPSSRRGIPQHARQIASVLQRLPDEIDTVSFVTHSMGGIVLRQMLARERDRFDGIVVGRIVMLAPPTHGSDVAETLNEWYPARAIAGPGLEDLTPAEVENLPFPDVETGIIAGAQQDGEGVNPLLEGDDDGTLKLENVISKQATDVITFDRQHSLLLLDNRVPPAVRQFLDDGMFPDTLQ